MALATSSELETYLGRSLNSTELARADLLITLSGQAIKGYCRQELERSADDSQALQGNWGSTLVLPQRPVISVSSVTINTTTLTSGTDWWWDGGDVLYRGSREYAYGPDRLDFQAMRHELHWGGPSAKVTVVYTHGFASASDELNVPKGICLEMVARAMHTTPGVKQESIGQYSLTVDDPSTSGAVTLTATHRRMLRDTGLRRR